MAWAEIDNYGHQPRAHADGAESVVAQCGHVSIHLTRTEAEKFGNALIAAAKASAEEPHRRGYDRRERVFQPANDPRALPAVNIGEGSAS